MTNSFKDENVNFCLALHARKSRTTESKYHEIAFFAVVEDILHSTKQKYISEAFTAIILFEMRRREGKITGQF